VLIVATLLILERLLRPTSGETAPATPSKIEVRDGSRTVWLDPADILWAEAAGNYVELHTTAGDLLHRTSLAALERELAPCGFARIHRSRLVRRAAVRAVETNASGDFDAVLTDGARLGGSRRYRSGLGAQGLNS
jgi:DNA-binding LytR/AlgR family response regulator